ncbi:HNH endonuclease [Nodosilinea sp. FACHB-131]|uniref:HNH endonuclease signature motif containing protein n=1 Tax=Cyanophyceae TaxID=3028117 RepID=UPI001688D749|nr:HNH endonuclease signature motif containing protein [Nodosilinea sp. FACHB-131]MBD1871935.1 HNH endonuclease [Nodosilinea sp. FACHB-131]
MNRLTPEAIAEGLESGRYRYMRKQCKQGHEWAGTGKSLSRTSDKGCLFCSIESARAQYKNTDRNTEEYREIRRIRNQRYRDRLKAEGGDRLKEHRRKHIERNLQWRIESAESYRETLRRYRASEKGKLLKKKNENKRRAAKAGNHSVPYSRKDLRSRLSEFDSKCVYCAKTVTTENTHSWDHFIPLSKGGCDTLGNLVLACRFCNNSKKDRDPEAWYFAQPFATKRKWSALLKQLGKTEANQLPLI